MASRIPAAISLGRFIEIRDAIAQILMEEFTEQANLQTDPDVIAAIQETRFFPEQFHPFNEAEMLAVSIYLFNSTYDSQNVQHERGKYTFFLDMYGRSAATQDADGTNQEEGDKLIALKLQVVISLVRSILEDPHWHRLGFDPDVVPETFIHGHNVTGFQRTEPKHNQDGGNILMYRLIFEVTASENTRSIDAPPLALSSATVKIAETELGYEYIYDPNDLVP